MIRMRLELLNGRSSGFFELRNSIRKYHIGALGMSAPPQGRARDGRRRHEVVTLLNQLQEESKLPEQVGDLVAAYISGARENGMLTARHFPGHGNTATDSHVAPAPIAFWNGGRSTA